MEATSETVAKIKQVLNRRLREELFDWVDESGQFADGVRRCWDAVAGILDDLEEGMDCGPADYTSGRTQI